MQGMLERLVGMLGACGRLAAAGALEDAEPCTSEPPAHKPDEPSPSASETAPALAEPQARENESHAQEHPSRSASESGPSGLSIEVTNHAQDDLPSYVSKAAPAESYVSETASHAEDEPRLSASEAVPPDAENTTCMQSEPLSFIPAAATAEPCDTETASHAQDEPPLSTSEAVPADAETTEPLPSASGTATAEPCESGTTIDAQEQPPHSASETVPAEDEAALHAQDESPLSGFEAISAGAETATHAQVDPSPSASETDSGRTEPLASETITEAEDPTPAASEGALHAQDEPPLSALEAISAGAETATHAQDEPSPSASETDSGRTEPLAGETFTEPEELTPAASETASVTAAPTASEPNPHGPNELPCSFSETKPAEELVVNVETKPAEELVVNVDSADPRGLTDASPGEIDSVAATLLADLSAGRCAASLVELNLKKAGMFTLPPEVGSLINLVKLEVSLNPLESLPAEMAVLGNLHTLFCLGCKFTQVPEVVGKMQSLSMLSFKSNQLENIGESALPTSLQWLILTDNRLTSLPKSFGKLARLRKCMLTNNRLTALPTEIVDCRALELIRLADNKLTALPQGFLTLPKLSWLALAGNPIIGENVTPVPPRWASIGQLEIGEQLGAGGGGFVHRAVWSTEDESKGGMAMKTVAVKLFRDPGTVSDGNPMHEIDVAVMLHHPNVIQVLATLPSPRPGLILELLEMQSEEANAEQWGWKELGQPPSFTTCTRDVYPEGLRWMLPFILNTLRGVAAACAHLHIHKLTHGDLYAHNIMVRSDGVPKVGDFGAAYYYSNFDETSSRLIERIEVRAFGCLLDELLERIASEGVVEDETWLGLLQSLKEQCMSEDASSRPCFQEICEIINPGRA